MRLAAGLAALALVGCTAPDQPHLAGEHVPELRLVEPTPREVLAQACLADWCPLLRPAVAAELGCPVRTGPRKDAPWNAPPRSRLASSTIRPPWQAQRLGAGPGP